jgi:excisionase family DNA binding protein
VLIERLVYSAAEVRVLLGLSRASIYEAIRRGEIPSIRVGRRVMVPRAALEAMLAECGTTHVGDPEAHDGADGSRAPQKGEGRGASRPPSRPTALDRQPATEERRPTP